MRVYESVILITVLDAKIAFGAYVILRARDTMTNAWFTDVCFHLRATYWIVATFLPLARTYIIVFLTMAVVC